MRTIVIGAGPAGLTAAYQLAKEASDVLVFEAADCVGGLARSIRLRERRVDLGPHRFFSKDRRVNELWLEVVGRDYFMVNRQTRILYQGKLFHYPLEASDALAKLGPVEAARCLASYLYGRTGFQPVSDRHDEKGDRQDACPTFEAWVCSRFGRRLFEIFFKTYSEKLWGIPSNELDADFAAQRIKKFSLSEAIKSAFLPCHRRKHPTLADEFAYPVGGTGMVYERMAKAIQQRGGEVHLNTPVRKVLTVGQASSLSPLAGAKFQDRQDACPTRKVVGVELPSGETIPCDHVISTMPLTTLVMQLDDVPENVLNACRQLRFRNTVLVYLEVLGENPFFDQWIYVHSPQLRFGRVTNFANWKAEGRVPPRTRSEVSGGPPDTARETRTLPAILAMEYWCDAEEDFWKWSDERIVSLAREEIVKSGLVRDLARLGRSFVFRIPKCYPVYRRGYQEHLRVIREFLETISGLQAIGRYGSFKYNNQDHSILMGLLASENILYGKNHDLWAVNADYEHYQENGRISATGLAPIHAP